MMRRRGTFTLLAAGLVGGATRQAQAAGESLAESSFDAFIAAKLEDYGVPGAVVAVVAADGPVLVKGYGIRERALPDAVDPDTRFQIASLSKFVTATAIGTLVDRGVVGWDTPVSGYSPLTTLSVPYATENATLRDYLTHRTGLPAYTGDLLTELGYDRESLVERARHVPLAHGFRARWAYSNYGIFLGQEAAARAARTSPAELLAGFLGSLGMTRSGPGLPAMFGDANRAAAHDIDGSVMPFENVDAFSGAGAVVSTGADIGRWMQMLLANGSFGGTQVLSEATVRDIMAASMVQAPGGPLQDPNDCAGLGCESYHFLRGRVIEKNGALNGMRSIVTLIPERKLGIAVLCNKQLTVFPEAVRAEFLERELGRSGRDLQAEVRAEQPLWLSLVTAPKPPAAAPAPSHGLDAFSGRYNSALYGDLTITVAGGMLSAVIGPARYPAHFVHWSGDTFLLRFDAPDMSPGLVKFTFNGASAAAFDGSPGPGTPAIDYGHFARVRS